MTTYLALLRGINVGGHNKVGMDALRGLITALGHQDAKTYIQSGNVIFKSSQSELDQLAGEIEQRMTKDLGVTARVLLRTKEDLAKIIANNPYTSQEEDLTKLLVTFLAGTPTAEQVAQLVRPPDEPDQISFVGREIYLHCPNGYGNTKLNMPSIEKRLGLAATTRNWRVVNALHDLMSE